MKKIFWILGVLCLIITILVFTDTYGLFETNASAESKLSIGKWKIKINGTDAALSETINLNDFTYSSSNHTEDGYFAPGRSAEFVVEIDASESDTSVQYTLDIDDSEISEYPNIYTSIEDLDQGEEITTTSQTGVILLNSNNRVKRIKIYINWDNQIQYDESDTGLINKNLNLIISANFKQYIG